MWVLLCLEARSKAIRRALGKGGTSVGYKRCEDEFPPVLSILLVSNPQCAAGDVEWAHVVNFCRVHMREGRFLPDTAVNIHKNATLLCVVPFSGPKKP